MPIEVRELIIKANVQSQGAGSEVTHGDVKDNNSVTSREEIVQACLERILNILKEKYER
jgi:Family of unknown function (DUF5908)